MTIDQKASFLQNDYTRLLAGIEPGTSPVWGKMNVQQMIEHMGEYIGHAYGKVLFGVLTPEEHLPKMRAFLLSDKPFRENTPNSLLPDIPPPVRHTSIAVAIEEVQHELKQLEQQFAQDGNKKVINPFFGELDYDMTIHLLHKHAWHHLRQFGVAEPS